MKRREFIMLLGGAAAWSFVVREQCSLSRSPSAGHAIRPASVVSRVAALDKEQEPAGA